MENIHLMYHNPAEDDSAFLDKLGNTETEKMENIKEVQKSEAAPTHQQTQESSQITSENAVINNPVKIKVENFNFFYESVQALKSISMEIKKNSVAGIIGPSGCGKSTFLRCFNRMNDIIYNTRYDGNILIDGKNIFDKDLDVVDLRRNVGMVFLFLNQFPKSIF